MFSEKPDVDKDRAVWGRLRRQIASLSGRPQDANDYLNDAYLRLSEHDGSPIRNLEAFMVRIAVNLARDDHRRQRRRNLSTDQDLSAIADASPTPEEMLDVRQRLNAVQATLSRLNPRTRQILLMHRLDGLRYREIADRLGISESAVEKHVAKAALGLLRASKAL
ncbi:MAG TPA: sigma-70 family RNA polymerase sigma factor [Steroidobacter sp.]|uniref:RNA polymerase sigma factor n=1 Tax=Steroidobacter sp. TaxID=1978227 RepID=UPI002EDA6134